MSNNSKSPSGLVEVSGTGSTNQQNCEDQSGVACNFGPGNPGQGFNPNVTGDVDQPWILDHMYRTSIRQADANAPPSSKTGFRSTTPNSTQGPNGTGTMQGANRSGTMQGANGSGTMQSASRPIASANGEMFNNTDLNVTGDLDQAWILEHMYRTSVRQADANDQTSNIGSKGMFPNGSNGMGTMQGMNGTGSMQGANGSGRSVGLNGTNTMQGGSNGTGSTQGMNGTMQSGSASRPLNSTNAEMFNGINPNLTGDLDQPWILDHMYRTSVRQADASAPLSSNIGSKAMFQNGMGTIQPGSNSTGSMQGSNSTTQGPNGRSVGLNGTSTMQGANGSGTMQGANGSGTMQGANRSGTMQGANGSGTTQSGSALRPINSRNPEMFNGTNPNVTGDLDQPWILDHMYRTSVRQADANAPLSSKTGFNAMSSSAMQSRSNGAGTTQGANGSGITQSGLNGTGRSVGLNGTGRSVGLNGTGTMQGANGSRTMPGANDTMQSGSALQSFNSTNAEMLNGTNPNVTGDLDQPWILDHMYRTSVRQADANAPISSNVGSKAMFQNGSNGMGTMQGMKGTGSMQSGSNGTGRAVGLNGNGTGQSGLNDNGTGQSGNGTGQSGLNGTGTTMQGANGTGATKSGSAMRSINSTNPEMFNNTDPNITGDLDQPWILDHMYRTSVRQADANAPLSSKTGSKATFQNGLNGNGTMQGANGSGTMQGGANRSGTMQGANGSGTAQSGSALQSFNSTNAQMFNGTNPNVTGDLDQPWILDHMYRTSVRQADANAPLSSKTGFRSMTPSSMQSRSDGTGAMKGPNGSGTMQSGSNGTSTTQGPNGSGRSVGLNGTGTIQGSNGTCRAAGLNGTDSTQGSNGTQQSGSMVRSINSTNTEMFDVTDPNVTGDVDQPWVLDHMYRTSVRQADANAPLAFRSFQAPKQQNQNPYGSTSLGNNRPMDPNRQNSWDQRFQANQAQQAQDSFNREFGLNTSRTFDNSSSGGSGSYNNKSNGQGNFLSLLREFTRADPPNINGQNQTFPMHYLVSQGHLKLNETTGDNPRNNPVITSELERVERELAKVRGQGQQCGRGMGQQSSNYSGGNGMMSRSRLSRGGQQDGGPLANKILEDMYNIIQTQTATLRQSIIEELPGLIGRQINQKLNQSIPLVLLQLGSIKTANFLTEAMQKLVPLIAQGLVDTYGPGLVDVLPRLQNGTFECSRPCICGTGSGAKTDKKGRSMRGRSLGANKNSNRRRSSSKGQRSRSPGAGLGTSSGGRVHPGSGGTKGQGGSQKKASGGRRASSPSFNPGTSSDGRDHPNGGMKGQGVKRASGGRGASSPSSNHGDRSGGRDPGSSASRGRDKPLAGSSNSATHGSCDEPCEEVLRELFGDPSPARSRGNADNDFPESGSSSRGRSRPLPRSKSRFPKECKPTCPCKR